MKFVFFFFRSTRKHCPDCYFNLGNLYLKTGRKGLAFDSFQQAISQNGRLRHAWSNLVILSDELGQVSAALSTDTTRRSLTIFFLSSRL